ncbi:MAG: hypothetical protein ACFB6S_12070 [Geminicoccaceae bacterium]
MNETLVMNERAPRDMALRWARIGAVAYIAWGLWHIQVVVRLWSAGASFEPEAIGLRLQQGAFHILFFVAVSIIIGAWLNWRNSRTGYWINLVTVGWTEIGLFYLFMLPGLFPWLPTGWIGPALWLVAVVTTTVALTLKQRDGLAAGDGS